MTLPDLSREGVARWLYETYWGSASHAPWDCHLNGKSDYRRMADAVLALLAAARGATRAPVEAGAWLVCEDSDAGRRGSTLFFRDVALAQAQAVRMNHGHSALRYAVVPLYAAPSGDEAALLKECREMLNATSVFNSPQLPDERARIYLLARLDSAIKRAALRGEAGK